MKHPVRVDDNQPINIKKYFQKGKGLLSALFTTHQS